MKQIKNIKIAVFMISFILILSGIALSNQTEIGVTTHKSEEIEDFVSFTDISSNKESTGAFLENVESEITFVSYPSFLINDDRCIESKGYCNVTITGESKYYNGAFSTRIQYSQKDSGLSFDSGWVEGIKASISADGLWGMTDKDGNNYIATFTVYARNSGIFFEQVSSSLNTNRIILDKYFKPIDNSWRQDNE